MSLASVLTFPNPVNEKAARVVAGCVVLSGLVILLGGWYWLTVPLAVGFALRVASGPRFSLFGLLATRLVAPRLGRAKLVPGPPKRFAQAIGLTFSTAAAVLALVADQPLAAGIVLAVLVVFATLESVVGFCAGCWVFGLLMRAGVIPESTCEACASWRPTAG
ncbi:hypothetical protein FHX74_001143 [Friedmanniella endophytica]|uniref:DUF4395 domain-containing protein n=1 Tax=Microlunatus kandeliicorticis TaxID=1759536 RepID=A0A7W3IQV0_9ACTN|nr:DUF4395 domain-containing protein [Microlunatus kandeliicorticis]MBA8793538.1 hypothetical protein [Microlunatus kandeliicorticis]